MNVGAASLFAQIPTREQMLKHGLRDVTSTVKPLPTTPEQRAAHVRYVAAGREEQRALRANQPRPIQETKTIPLPDVNTLSGEGLRNTTEFVQLLIDTKMGKGLFVQASKGSETTQSLQAYMSWLKNRSSLDVKV